MDGNSYAFRGARLITCRGKHPELSWRKWEAIEGSSRDISAYNENRYVSRGKGKGKAPERRNEPRSRRLTDPFLLALREVRSLRAGRAASVGDEVDGVLFGRVDRTGVRLVLWVFEVKDVVGKPSLLTDLSFHGLAEVDRSPSPIKLNTLIPCAPHRRITCNTCVHPLTITDIPPTGSYLTDLSSIQPSLDDQTEIATAWMTLTEAVVDVIAWEEGWFGERMAAELETGVEGEEEGRRKGGRRSAPILSPLPTGKLLLQLGPRCRIAMDPSIQMDTEVYGSPPEQGLFRLWPLKRNGWVIQTGDLSEELCEQLREDFEAVLGRSWLVGLAPGQEVVWSMFWTTLSEGPLPLAGLKEGSSGVVAIWPMHLLAPPLGVRTTVRPGSSTTGRVPTDIGDSQAVDIIPRTTEWLMEQAQELQAAWQEHIIRPPEPLPQPEPVILMDPVPESALDIVDSGLKDEMMEDSNDEDDLFGSSSPEADDSIRDSSRLNGESLLAGPIAHDSVEAASSTLMSPTFQGGPERYAGVVHAINPDAMVTEDDFDFFDAPAESPRLISYEGLMEGAVDLSLAQQPYDEGSYGSDMDGGFDLDKLLASQGLDEKGMILDQSLQAYDTSAFDHTFSGAEMNFVHEDPATVVDITPEETHLPFLEIEDPASSPPSTISESVPNFVPPIALAPCHSSPADAIRHRLNDSLPLLLHTASGSNISQIMRDLVPKRLWPVLCRHNKARAAGFHSRITLKWGDGRVRDRRSLRKRLREEEECRRKKREIAERKLLSFWHPNAIDPAGTMAQDVFAGAEAEYASPGSAGHDWDQEDFLSTPSAADDQESDPLDNLPSIGVDLFVGHLTPEMAFRYGINLTAVQADTLEPVYLEDAIEYIADDGTLIEPEAGQSCAVPVLLPWSATTLKSFSGWNRPITEGAILLTGVWDKDDIYAVSQPLDAPEILAGHDGNIMRLSSAAIPYWPQLRLEPWGGRRDLTVHWVYDQQGFDAEGIASRQDAVGRAYAACGLGELRWHSHAVEMARLATIPDQEIIRDLTVLNVVIRFSRVPLRSNTAQPPRLSMFITQDDISSPDMLRRLAFSLYDKHNYASGAARTGNGGPAFVLAERDPFARSIFTRAWPPPAVDLIKNRRFLHVAYRIRDHSLEIVCADGQGERLNRRQESLDSKGRGAHAIVRSVWATVLDFARGAGIEWRMNVMLSEAGTMKEVEAWHALFAEALSSVTRPIYVTLSLLKPEQSSLIGIPETTHLTNPILISSPVRQYIYLPATNSLSAKSPSPPSSPSSPSQSSSNTSHDRLTCPESSSYIITPSSRGTGSTTSHTTIESLHIILFGRSEKFSVAYTRGEYVRELAQNIRDLRALRVE